MINKNSHSNNEYRYPFLLRPVGKDYLWGGERLNTEFGKNINLHPLAETWECSTHQDGVSQIASGIYAGLETVHLLFRAELFAAVSDRPFYAADGKYVCFR